MVHRIQVLLFCAFLSSLLGSGGVAELLFAEPIRTVDPNLETLAEGTDPMPRLVPSISAERHPEFIAADRVLLPDGTVDPTLFQPGEAFIIQSRLAQPPSDDGCIHIDLQDSSNLPWGGRRIPITEAIQSSDNVVVTEVTGHIYGYKSSSAGTLLRVVTREILRGEANQTGYYVHFPVGSFQIRGRRVCRTTSGFPAPPGIGEHLLLLYDDIQFSPKTEFLEIRATDVVVLPKHGAIAFSNYFASESTEFKDWTSEKFLESTRLRMSPRLKEERNQ